MSQVKTKFTFNVKLDTKIYSVDISEVKLVAQASCL